MLGRAHSAATARHPAWCPSRRDGLEDRIAGWVAVASRRYALVPDGPRPRSAHSPPKHPLTPQRLAPTALRWNDSAVRVRVLASGVFTQTRTARFGFRVWAV